MAYEIVVANDQITEYSILCRCQTIKRTFTNLILLTLSFAQKLVVVAPKAMKLALAEPSGATKLIGAKG